MKCATGLNSRNSLRSTCCTYTFMRPFFSLACFLAVVRLILESTRLAHCFCFADVSGAGIASTLAERITSFQYLFSVPLLGNRNSFQHLFSVPLLRIRNSFQCLFSVLSAARAEAVLPNCLLPTLGTGVWGLSTLPVESCAP